ncbi:MAG: fused FliR family export protein/FlhB family type III secretion system protein [Clostridiaceae bacterium]
MIDTVYFTALILVFIRISSFFLAVPVLFPRAFPNTVKVLLLLSISFMIVPSINTGNIGDINSNYILITNVIAEVLTGLILGYVTNLCFMAIRFAGNLLDIQAGFAMMSLFDPNTSSNITLIENILYMMASMLFFLSNGHHVLIGAIIDSFNVASIGTFITYDKTLLMIAKSFSDFFTIGFKIALPIVIILLITDITMGLLARTVPQLNVMILGLPIKILLSLGMIAFLLPLFAKYIASTFDQIPNAIKGIYNTLPILFIFSDDKTEEATPKKKEEAKKKGQIARSKEVSLAFTLLASAIVIMAFGDYVIELLKSIMYFFLSEKVISDVTAESIKSLNIYTISKLGIAIGPFAMAIMVIGVASNYAQTGVIKTTDTLKPDFNKINPINGFKRMFSLRTVVELIKDIAVISIVGLICYKFIVSNLNNLMTINTLQTDSIAYSLKDIVSSIFIRVSIVLIVISLADYLYQRWQHNKDLRMSKQEIKEEYKQMEGSQEVKQKRKEKMRELARRRMISEVPNATVVVTNPTHLAIALKYEEGVSDVPKVVAKGSGAIALRIKEVAKENDVPIFENKPLARLIYSNVEIEDEIPAEMYSAVAEILALVFKTKKR